MKRVLITGADGFIGRHCLKALQAVAEDVHATTIDGINDSLESMARWHRVNLLDSAQVADLMQRVRPTHLLHLAWHLETGMKLNTMQNFDWVKSGIDLLAAFHQNGGKRLVVSGSCAEYDWRHAYLSETRTPIFPTTLYGSTKHALQTLVDAYCRVHPITYAWARIFFIFGPHEKPKRLVASVIRSLLNGETARCSHGEQIRDYLYVKDVADALVTLLCSTSTGPVNIGSGDPIKIRQLVERIAALIDNRQDLLQFGALPSPENDPPVLLADIHRLQTELGWQPSYSLDVALHETIDWWKKHNLDMTI